jgi:diacylglycerol kinase (ATP)
VQEPNLNTLDRMKSNIAIPANLSPELSHTALEEPSLEPMTFTAKVFYGRAKALQVAPNLFASFKFAWAGLSYAFVTQRNFRIHVLVGSIALALSIHFHLPSVELAVIGLTVGGVLTMELLNTALEAVVDLTVGQTYHFLAKIAKDCAAGAVLIAAFAALVVAGTLLLPHILLSLAF